MKLPTSKIINSNVLFLILAITFDILYRFSNTLETFATSDNTSSTNSFLFLILFSISSISFCLFLISFLFILIVLFLNKGNQDFIRESIGVNKSFNLISLIELFFEKYIRKMQVNQMENRKVNNKSVINDYYNFFVNEDTIKYITSKYFKLLEEYDVDKVNLENEEGYESIEEVCHKIYNGLMKDLKELNNKYNSISEMGFLLIIK